MTHILFVAQRHTGVEGPLTVTGAAGPAAFHAQTPAGSALVDP